MTNDSKLPLLSVVIPAFNCENTIVPCLESVFASRLNEGQFEVIVVDNNSQDRTSEFVKKYPVRYLFLQKRGRSAARNFGLKEAKANYIAFVDSDVILDSRWLQNLYDYVQENKLQGAQAKIIPDVLIGSKSLNEYRYWKAHQETDGSFLLLSQLNYAFPMINTAACIYERSALVEVGGFDENLNRHEDIDLARRILLKGGQLGGYENASVKVIFHSMRWSAYISRAFDEGYWKAFYLRKWDGFEIQFRDGQKLDRLQLVKKFIANIFTNLEFKTLISALLIAVSLAGRMYGSFILQLKAFNKFGDSSVKPINTNVFLGRKIVSVVSSGKKISIGMGQP